MDPNYYLRFSRFLPKPKTDPRLKIDPPKPRVTSDRIPGNGTKRDAKVYTGNEIAGVATMHKSNTVPVRRDNIQEAKELARMRRG